MTQRAVTQMKRIFARTKKGGGRGRTSAFPPSPNPLLAWGHRAFSTLPLVAPRIAIRLEMRDVFEIVPGEIEIRRTFVGLRRAVALCCDVNG